MGLMFATRNPTEDEESLIMKMISTFRDGTGNQKDSDGGTRASWRELERCFAEAVSAIASEDKNIFDVIAADETDPSLYYGFSIKSKQLSQKQFWGLDSRSRTYMEIANSPAKFWQKISDQGITEEDFKCMRFANVIGNTVLQTVKEWHHEGKSDFEGINPGVTLNLDASCYLCISYTKVDVSDDREYQIHSFALDFPQELNWEYTSDKCLRAYDPNFENETLFDWYGLSGGQLKYYPRGASARFKSSAFKLLKPSNSLTIREKVELYFS